MAKEVLALDIDDVVVKHVEGFVEFSNRMFGTNLTRDDYTEAWDEIWHTDKEKTEARKRLFFTDEIVGAFEVIEGASEGIIALSAVKKIIGVTSRRESLQSITEQALEMIAPGAIDKVIFATYFRDGEKFTRSKADICLEIGAADFVDDHFKHCLAVAEVGINAVLFGDNPWSQPEGMLPNNIIRKRDWPELVTHFGASPPNETARG